ncbi:ABC transporter ATP-binding protein [Breoghania sp. L-A4]|uniref:ABC transporter ATP-binding protein n=1 Tax=Breoghania sp. L-A4 TaxID=2304600 RepID=UPI0020BF91B3|nr:ABC transporter ATP-binding protein [Breoghania sp. L-A4]
MQPTTGTISIGGKPMTGIGPNKRPTALIFQNLALFPLMSIWENVAFGLEARGMPKRQRRARAEELLALVALDGQAEKTPGELSGGQRQRVAVARALAVEPAVLLLDEPLSALDLKLRQHMRAELKEIQRKTGVTFIYITHDQGEALTMSDSIAVMNAGRIEQVASSDEIYENPASPFVATFVGEQNVFRGRITGKANGMAQVETPLGTFTGQTRGTLTEGAEAMIFIRPERLGLAAGAQSFENTLSADLERRDLEGAFVNLFMRADDTRVSMHMTNAGEAGRNLSGRQTIGFNSDDAIVMPAGDLARD